MHRAEDVEGQSVKNTWRNVPVKSLSGKREPHLRIVIPGEAHNALRTALSKPNVKGTIESATTATIATIGSWQAE